MDLFKLGRFKNAPENTDIVAVKNCTGFQVDHPALPVKWKIGQYLL